VSSWWGIIGGASALGNQRCCNLLVASLKPENTKGTKFLGVGGRRMRLAKFDIARSNRKRGQDAALLQHASARETPALHVSLGW
jgi:hypothetical protein